jgi:release factor glutamine methyltransferase
MFVQTNSILAVKTYIKERLSELYNEREVSFMTQQMILLRMNWDRTAYLLGDSALVSESDLLFFRDVVKRLQQEEPFQYIIGTTFFYGLEIQTDFRALIPRPETEELVDWVVHSFQNESKLKIWDVCTGSGCIALALKSHFSTAKVIGSDLSSEALDLALQNAKRLTLDVEFVKKDALHTDIDKGESVDFDCIVSNPPYIPQCDMEKMERNVLEYEPKMALFVNDFEPIVFYDAIATTANKVLKRGGMLFFEIHEDFSKEVILNLEEKGFNQIIVKKDLQGKPRMIRATK